MSQSQIIKGGSPTPAGDLVATDQQTIFGSGSARDPLRTAGADLDVSISVIGVAPVGMPVIISPSSPASGTMIVTKGSGVGSQGHATIFGLVTSAVAPQKIQTDGIVTLTEAEWDVVAGTTGGLVPGEAYFANTDGTMADVAPGTPGNFSAQIGVAMNATQMKLCLPAVPVLV